MVRAGLTEPPVTTPKPRMQSVIVIPIAAGSRLLGLRTAEGMAPPAGFDTELDELVAGGLIAQVDGRVVPTRRGMDLHNQIALAVL